MYRVTSTRERRGLVEVYLDGEYWAELDAAVISERGISDGVEIPESELEEIRTSGERSQAMSRALSLLAYRARSEGEIRERLKRAGYWDKTVAAVISRLIELGYLDDEDFARQRAHEKARSGYGPRRVSFDLWRSGVDEEIVRGVLAEEFVEERELRDARQAALRRYNTQERSGALARRVYGFLMRRGYSSQVCGEVARLYRTEETG